jgi:hypothetical protein
MIGSALHSLGSPQVTRYTETCRASLVVVDGAAVKLRDAIREAGKFVVVIKACAQKTKRSMVWCYAKHCFVYLEEGKYEWGHVGMTRTNITPLPPPFFPS